MLNVRLNKSLRDLLFSSLIQVTQKVGESAKYYKNLSPNLALVGRIKRKCRKANVCGLVVLPITGENRIRK